MASMQVGVDHPSTAGRPSRRSAIVTAVGVVLSAAAGAAAVSLFSAAGRWGGGGVAPETGAAAAAVGTDGLLYPAVRMDTADANTTLKDPATVALVAAATAAAVRNLPPLPLPALFTRHGGFFNLYTGKGDLHNAVLLEVPASALGVPFLLTTVVAASDMQVMSTGRPFQLGSGSYSKKVMAFRKSAGEGRSLDLYRPLMDLRSEKRADRDTAFPAAGYWAGWLQTFPVRDLNADTYVIDISRWIREGMNEVTDMASPPAGQWSAVERRFTSGTAHARSVELDVEVRLRQINAQANLPFSPENWVSTRVRHSILPLPAKAMEARPADGRIGYFSSSYIAIDDLSGNRNKRSLINRWDLRKGPVTFIIDPSTPMRWRSTVKKGVLKWNKAFAAAGFPEALAAVAPGDKDWPSDYSIGDGRYNTIYWAPGQAASSASGTMEVDPRSGEIMRAHVVLTGTLFAGTLRRFRSIAGPKGTATSAASGRPAANITLDEVLGQKVTLLVLHEIGHVLGLRHNFRGSAAVSLNDLADPAAVAKWGLSGSVMDYNDEVVRANPADQTPMVASTTLGRYDVAAIVYGYGKFASEAKRVAFARKTAASGLLFCTDDDADQADPYCSRWDTSASPMTYANEAVGVALASMRATAAAARRNDMVSALDMSSAVMGGLGMAAFQLRMIVSWIGGVVPSRTGSGDANGRTVTPVDGATQNAAMGILAAALDPVRGVLGSTTAAEFGPLLIARSCYGESEPADYDCLGVAAADVVATLRSQRGRLLTLLTDANRLARLTESIGGGSTDVPSVAAVLRRLSTVLIVPAAATDAVAADAGVQWVGTLLALMRARGSHHPVAVGAAAAELRRLAADTSARTDATSAGLAALLKDWDASA